MTRHDNNEIQRAVKLKCFDVSIMIGYLTTKFQ